MIMDKRVLEFLGRAEAKVDATDKKIKATTERCKDEETIQVQPQGTENNFEGGNRQQIVYCSNTSVADIEAVSGVHRATNSNSSMREEPKTEAETNEDTKL